MTKADMIEIMDMYISPLYYIIGSALAVIVIGLAVVVFIKPWMRLK